MTKYHSTRSARPLIVSGRKTWYVFQYGAPGKCTPHDLQYLTNPEGLQPSKQVTQREIISTDSRLSTTM